MTIKSNGLFTKYYHLGQYHIISLILHNNSMLHYNCPHSTLGQSRITEATCPEPKSTITGVNGGDFAEGGSGQECLIP